MHLALLIGKPRNDCIILHLLLMMMMMLFVNDGKHHHDIAALALD